MLNPPRQISQDWKLGPSPTATYILALVTDGNLIYQFQQGSMHLAGGDLLFMPQHLLRSARSCPPGFHKMYSAHFHPDDREAALPFLHYKEPRKLRLDRFEYVRSRFAALHDAWQSHEPFRDMLCEAILQEILIVVNRELELDRHGTRKRHTIQQLQSYIQTHYGDKITLEELARLVGRTPNYICHLYKEMTGQTPIEYVNQVRVSVARELLMSTELGTADIAEKVGFSDPYYFGKVYKKITGFPPKRSMTE
ncbi:AraC family transcriptional regulator [Paenibacillus sp. HB172176]|uniref:helix-turn-helix transcriptional regulator n=1 Tax=Paenibacillus sp. HB172176 TaxID=2493690 RepID=UPI00143B38D9|nr:AraC family transcriptional regulator [Paenibacillus sp. HB172176]